MRSHLALSFALILAASVMSGCVTTQTPATEPTELDEASAAPVLLPDPITAFEVLPGVTLDGGGNGIAIDEARSLVFNSRAGGGFAIVDVSRPDHPELLGTNGEVGNIRDVDVVRWNNTTFAVASASDDGIHVLDTTDPTDPRLVATADTYASHTLTWLPGTPYVYNSNGFLPDRLIPVLDLSDPANPVDHVIEIPLTVAGLPVQSDGCHDITVRPDLGLAFCAGGGSFYTAGGGETLILDISEDPLAPTFIGVVDNPSIMYHHQALASEDGTLLFINDEFIAPNCQGGDLPMLGSRGQTTAAMWIYDIEDPTAPELVSWVQPNSNEPVVNCGSHFGDLVDGTDYVVWGWYQGGTVLIDVSDPGMPRIVDRVAPSGSVWEARYHAGVVYGSASELDVLRLA